MKRLYKTKSGLLGLNLLYSEVMLGIAAIQLLLNLVGIHRTNDFIYEFI